MTLDEIRTKLASGEVAPRANDLIATGELPRLGGEGTKYGVHCGWDIAKAFACDRGWGQFNIVLLEYIEKNFAEGDERNEALANSSLEDHHWDWFMKAAIHCTDEYRWFFLYADGEPQAACLIFHPKPSIFSAGNIFYVEYIAVAPWNRANVMQEKIFGGIGTRMLKHAVEYCRDALGLEPGFSLHALPRAIAFYERIGMLRSENMDKGVLAYYEMPEKAFHAFAA